MNLHKISIAGTCVCVLKFRNFGTPANQKTRTQMRVFWFAGVPKFRSHECDILVWFVRVFQVCQTPSGKTWTCPLLLLERNFHLSECPRLVISAQDEGRYHKTGSAMYLYVCPQHKISTDGTCGRVQKFRNFWTLFSHVNTIQVLWKMLLKMRRIKKGGAPVEDAALNKY